MKDTGYDPQLMFTCHRYGGPATAEAIQSYIDFRDRSDRPMYMGEICHNTDEWQADFVKVMKANNIGYTFWPYKKEGGSCMMGITLPDGWEEVVRFAEGPHHTFAEIRDAKPDRAKAQAALDKFLEQCKAANCTPQAGYIESIGLSMPK